MADLGRLYVLYLSPRPADEALVINLPAGTYAVQWLDPIGCQAIQTDTIDHSGHRLQLTLPPTSDNLADDLILKIQKQ